MAASAHDLSAEIETFAAPLVASGKFSSTEDVLHAAMDALRREALAEERENALLEQLAEEGEASGELRGDAFAIVRQKYGLKSARLS